MEGDKKSLLHLFEMEGTSILYMCIKIMGNLQDGEDAAQEVFLKVQKNISKLQASQAYPVWINKLTINTCLDMRGLMKGKMEVASLETYSEQIGEGRKEFLPIEYAEQKDLQEKLLQAIDTLLPNYKTVVLLYYYEGLSQKEIADTLEISENAVSHRLRRARNDIREYLELKDSHAPIEYTLSIGVPVLTQALNMQSKSIVTPEVLNHLVAVSKAAIPVKTSTLVTSATTSKIVLSLAAVGLLGSIGTWAIINGNAKKSTFTSNSGLLVNIETQENSQLNSGIYSETENSDKFGRKSAISVKFSSFNNSRSNVNPAECIIEVFDSPNAEIFWQIKDFDTNTVVLEGTQTTIGKELLAIDSDQDVKKYILCVTAKADTGEISKVEQTFTITK